MASQEVVLRSDRSVSVEDFMPLLTVDQAVARKGQVNGFIQKVFKEDEDFGEIAGGQKKKVLLKPGAEKLCSIFGLSPQYIAEKIIEDWTGEDHGGEPLFYYEFRCSLSRGDRFMGEAIGSANSWESKYRYRWVPEEVAKQRPDFDRLGKRGGTRTHFEPQFALAKRETSGKYGKPAEYWALFDGPGVTSGKKKLGPKEYEGCFVTVDETQYRIPNPDIADVVNTCQKMAQKRALVAAVLVVTNCSDAFTQDLEDFEQPQDSGPRVPSEPEVQRGEDRKPTPEPGAQYPEAIRSFCLAVDTTPAGDLPNTFQSILQLVRKQFVTRDSEFGSAKYESIGRTWNEAHKGTKTRRMMTDLLVELHQAVESLIPNAPDHDGITDQDVPK